MKIRSVQEAPDRSLADELEQFEPQFRYPLGPGQNFSISHGRDYARFFRAIDRESGASFVAVNRAGKACGTLGVAIRPLLFPTGEQRLAAYLGDLKTAPGPGRGWTLLRLATEATAWSIARGAVCAYGVVMDGTEKLPSNYTGKSGIHAFREVGKLCVIRIPTPDSAVDESAATEIDAAAAEDYFRKLSAGTFAPLGGDPHRRSAIAPIALVASDTSACGILEDTRNAKRLILDGGEEMLAAHLSKFAYRDPASGARLIREALGRCRRQNIAPALFVSVPECHSAAFIELLGGPSNLVTAPATIYGTELDNSDDRWNIATSEI
jgi:hypothetical protein